MDGGDSHAYKTVVSGAFIHATTASFQVISTNQSHMLFVDCANDKVGIGVSDPDVTLEVLSTSTQQKWSYDSNSYSTIAVADSSHTTLSTGESGRRENMETAH